MNFESAARYSTEELKKRNMLPAPMEPEPPVPQPIQPTPPIVIQCAVPKSVALLEQRIYGQEKQMAAQAKLLREMRNELPGKEQMEKLTQEVKTLQTLIEQVGRQNERKPFLVRACNLLACLRDALPGPVAFLCILLCSATLVMLLYGWAALLK